MNNHVRLYTDVYVGNAATTILSHLMTCIFICESILYRHLLYVFVCFLPIHSGHQVRWTYQPGSHRRKVTQDF